MSEPHYAFDEKWFARHQSNILWFLNSNIFKYLARWILRIHKDCSMSNHINAIGPNRFSYGARMINDEEVEIKTDFRTHNKFSKRMYHAFAPIWWMMHFWDWLVADRFLPRLSFGFSTLTVYPDIASGNTTVDGIVFRSGINETFSTISSGAGTGNSTGGGSRQFVQISASTTSNQFSSLQRGIFTFDTSPLTASAIISNGVFSLYGTTKANAIGSDNIHICSATPASNNNLANADYSQLGNTSFANIVYASYSTTGYNNFTLDSNGISNISKTSISKFGVRGGWDINNSFTGSWSSNGETFLAASSADEIGTSQDPKLVVTYTIPNHNPDFFMILLN